MKSYSKPILTEYSYSEDKMQLFSKKNNNVSYSIHNDEIRNKIALSNTASCNFTYFKVSFANVR